MPESNTTPTPQEPMQPAALSGLTKRQQLKKTNQNIFIWVATAAVLLAFSIVALQFLVRQGLFNAKIISEQQATERTLTQNKANFDGLKRNVDALLADMNLAALRANQTDSTLQVVLDALPTTGDSTTFSNSLYSKILSRHGVTISTVTVNPATGLGITDPSVASPATTTGAVDGAQALPFEAVISGSPDQIRDTLLDVERVIRPIVIRQLNIAAEETGLRATFQGETYYLPRSTVKLGDKTVTP